MIIRESINKDIFEIEKVHSLAFGDKEGPVIVKLVHDLFKDKTARPIFSLVVEDDKKIIGHILFTKAMIEGSKTPAQILAPLAVLPEYQNKGIGGGLIKKGLILLKDSSISLVFVLGYPKYYSKFGFKNDAKKLGFEAPYEIDEKNKDAWMVQELRTGMIGSIQGKVKCAKAMDKKEYWEE